MAHGGVQFGRQNSDRYGTIARDLVLGDGRMSGDKSSILTPQTSREKSVVAHDAVGVGAKPTILVMRIVHTGDIGGPFAAYPSPFRISIRLVPMNCTRYS